MHTYIGVKWAIGRPQRFFLQNWWSIQLKRLGTGAIELYTSTRVYSSYNNIL